MFVDEVFKVGRLGVDVEVHECGLQVRRWDGAVAVIIEAIENGLKPLEMLLPEGSSLRGRGDIVITAGGRRGLGVR